MEVLVGSAGDGQHKFMPTALGADINDNDAITVDRFRIKIWHQASYLECPLLSGTNAADYVKASSVQKKCGP